MEEALFYISQVECEFIKQPEVLADFRKTMKEYLFRNLEIPEVTQLVSNMFRDHPELIVGFNEYIPSRYKINFEIKPKKMSVGDGSSVGSTGTSLAPLLSTQQSTANPPTGKLLDKATPYLNQVKTEFRNQPKVYEDFLVIATDLFSVTDKTAPELLERASNLLQGHPELIVGLNKFLPSRYKIKVEPNDEKMQVEDGSSLSTTGMSLTPLLSTQQSTANPPTGKLRNKATPYLNQVKTEFRNQPKLYEDFLVLTSELLPVNDKTPPELLERMSNLLQGHPELIVGFNKFLPLRYKIKVEPNEKMQVEDGSSLSTGTSLTPLVQTLRTTTANPATASSKSAAESSAENNQSAHLSKSPNKSFNGLILGSTGKSLTFLRFIQETPANPATASSTSSAGSQQSAHLSNSPNKSLKAYGKVDDGSSAGTFLTPSPLRATGQTPANPATDASSISAAGSQQSAPFSNSPNKSLKAQTTANASSTSAATSTKRSNSPDGKSRKTYLRLRLRI